MIAFIIGIAIGGALTMIGVFSALMTASYWDDREDSDDYTRDA